MTNPETGLAERLTRWMAGNRNGLDALMAQEGSRAIHEEFLLAESGSLPDRLTRIERARGASARAWMRHLGNALSDEWPAAGPDLADRLAVWMTANRERLEALVLDEQAISERRGASGDPHADRRDVDLGANCRLFAEGLATVAAPLAEGPESPPEFARRVAAFTRQNAGRRRAAEMEAREAWSAGDRREVAPQMSAATSAPEPDEMRVQEAASVWAHVRTLAEALEHTLGARPEASA